ncbi:MAG: Xaa-Pro peptidase family protein [Patescibacteria group bacterium]
MYKNRVSVVRTSLPTIKADSFLVSNFYSIFYLTGIQTLTPEEREAFLFITEKNTYFFTDGRYVDDELLNKISSLNGTFKLIEVGKGLMYHLGEIIKEEKLQSIAFEEEDLKYKEYLSLQNLLIKLTPVAHLITGLREIKTTEEVELVKKACELTDLCLAEITPLIKPKMSEKELSWKLESWIREHGYQIAFDPIVAVDQNSAIPHYDTRTGNGVIGASSILLLDFGIRYKNYNSDITRMVFIGKQSDEVIHTYKRLAAAQEKTVQFVKKGVELREVDLFCREQLKKYHLPDYMHSTGHGVGLEVHELPKVSFNSKDTLKQQHIFTIEPGVYLLGKYGMRVEDTVYIDKDFNASQLTLFSKEFINL